MHILVLLIVASAFLISSPAAYAQSRICRDLAEMARGGGDTRGAQRELREATKAAKSRRCLGFFFRNRDRSCRALIARIDRLEHRLERGNSRQRLSGRQLQREMSRHGCLEKTPQTKADRSPSRYKTVCVRKCDGYFFPLAYQQDKGGFNRDQNICQGIYGKDQAELYFFPSDGTIDNARSISGEAYKDKSFAFLYQRQFRQDCQGQLHAGLSKVRASFLAAADRVRFKQFAVIPIPVPRPSSSDEPDVWKPRGIPAAQPVNYVVEGVEPYLPDKSSSLAFSGADPTDDSRKIATEAGMGTVAYGEPRTVGDSNPFVEANTGAPAKIPGYTPPQIKDFRAALRASALPRPP